MLFSQGEPDSYTIFFQTCGGWTRARGILIALLLFLGLLTPTLNFFSFESSEFGHVVVVLGILLALMWLVAEAKVAPE